MTNQSSLFNFYKAAESGGKSREKSPWPLRLFSSLMMLVLLTIIVDIGIVFAIPDGLNILKTAYNEEVELLGNSLNERGVEFIGNWTHEIYAKLFLQTGLHDWLYRSNGKITHPLLSSAWPYIQGVLIGMQILFIRVAVIVLMMPFLLLVVLVSITDGVLIWYRRRTSGARESGFIYHRSKGMTSWIVLTFWFLYLLPPIAINPIYVFFPLALFLSVFTRLTVQYFKKYL